MTEAWFTARHKSFNEIKTWKQYFFHKYNMKNNFSQNLIEKEIPQNQLKIILLEKKLESNLSPNNAHVSLHH